MSEETRQPDEIEAQIGDKKLRIRGSDVLGMINMLAIGVMLYGTYQHVEAAKESNKDIAQAVREQAQAQMQMVRALQESNCLNRLTMEQKKSAAEIEWCKKIGAGKAF